MKSLPLSLAASTPPPWNVTQLPTQQHHLRTQTAAMDSSSLGARIDTTLSVFRILPFSDERVDERKTGQFELIH